MISVSFLLENLRIIMHIYRRPLQLLCKIKALIKKEYIGVTIILSLHIARGY